MGDNFHKAVESVLGVVIFENWLRFYFMREKQANNHELLCLEIPPQKMGDIKNLYPQYLELAQSLDGREVDFAASQAAICNYLITTLEGGAFPRNTAQAVLASAPFQVAMQLFNAWVQLHAEQLEHSFLQFAMWQSLFNQWRESPGGQELAEKLLAS